jgi:protein ImuB
VPDDPPILFRWRRALHRVRAASGPERIAAEWWRRSPEPYRFRDYYYVEDTTGARFWLFRTGLPGDVTPTLWFLHGLFG